MQRIGIFGASFNPPTLGHRDVVNQALSHFDQILLVPSLAHPFKKTLISIDHRLEMLTLFMQQWPDANKIKIVNIEASIKASNPHSPVYTYDVLSALTDAYHTQQQAVSIRFILGPDNAHPTVWQKFYRYQEIEQKWPLFIAKERISIHSTLVKEVIRQYQSQMQLKQQLVQLVGESIAQYILDHHLYREQKE